MESRRILAWNVALLRMEVAVLNFNTIFKIWDDFSAFLLVQSLKGLCHWLAVYRLSIVGVCHT